MYKIVITLLRKRNDKKQTNIKQVQTSRIFVCSNKILSISASLRLRTTVPEQGASLFFLFRRCVVARATWRRKEIARKRLIESRWQIRGYHFPWFKHERVFRVENKEEKLHAPRARDNYWMPLRMVGRGGSRKKRGEPVTVEERTQPSRAAASVAERKRGGERACRCLIRGVKT